MTAVWTKPLFYFQTLHFSDSCMTAVWKFLCSTFRHSTFLTAVWQLCEKIPCPTFRHSTFLTAVWQLCEKSLVLLLDTPLFWQLYDSCVKNPLFYFQTLHFSDSCMTAVWKMSCYINLTCQILLFPLKLCKKFPSKSGTPNPYIRPPISGQTGQDTAPLHSSHTITPLYSILLLGTEEAQQCRKIASHCLSLTP
jgi:hypothetical protein